MKKLIIGIAAATLTLVGCGTLTSLFGEPCTEETCPDDGGVLYEEIPQEEDDRPLNGAPIPLQ